MRLKNTLLSSMSLLSATSLVILFSHTKVAAEAVGFTLMNRTSYTITNFYASPAGVSDWEDDILGDHVLQPGQGSHILINDGRRACDYDVKVVFSDGTATTKYNINFCNLDGETFNIDE